MAQVHVIINDTNKQTTEGNNNKQKHEIYKKIKLRQYMTLTYLDNLLHLSERLVLSRTSIASFP